MRLIARIEHWLLFEDEAARELSSRRGKIVKDSLAALGMTGEILRTLSCSPRRIRPAADRAKPRHLLLFYWCDLVGRDSVELAPRNIALPIPVRSISRLSSE